jgi:pimeloyl-ACP methyl ester carboxylesterase
VNNSYTKSVQLFDTLWHKYLKRPYRLDVMDCGRGTPVLLLHGVGASKDVWRAMVAQLDPERYHVIVPDLLGFGDSPKPQWALYTVEEHARAVIATLRQMKIVTPITIVGHSMGCLVASHIAATRPEIVRRLVLYEPPLFADDPEYQAHVRRRSRYFALYEFIATHPQLAFTQAQVLWRLAKRIVGLQLTPEEWVPFKQSLRNTIMRQTAYDELRTAKIPTDIIHGRLDMVVIRTDLRRMFRINPHITWHTVTDFHGISVRSARYLATLVTAPPAAKKRRRVYRYATKPRSGTVS